MRVQAERDGDWPEPPEPLPAWVLDSHTHLDLQDISVEQALGRAAAVGVHRIVQVAADLESSEWGAELASRYAPGRSDLGVDVLATVALHPNDAPKVAAKSPEALAAALRRIDELAALPYVHGVGETGLDYFRTSGPGLLAQRESFVSHIEIAKRHGKTLVIHDRDAHEDVLTVLDEVGAPDRVIFHCFSGDAEFAKKCISRGHYLSFAGNVTFKNAVKLREAAQVTPVDQLLVETDGPFLTPIPFRGRPNGPYLVPITVRFLAELRGDDLTALCNSLWANGERAFGISE